ncbi:MAG: MFS transporter [Chthoniobacterales bacterium]|nr:MFS transporter [Chthoniobacterales bacterium]
MTKKQLQLGTLLFAVFIDMLGFGIVMPILPRYAEMLGAPAWQIGWVMGIFSLAQLIMLPFWGHLSDRIGRKPVLVISMLGTAVGYLIMGVAHSMTMVLLGRALDGAAGGNISVIQASVSDLTTPEERAGMMGKIGAAYGFGFIFGPALGGWSAYYWGGAAPMLIGACLAALNVFLILAILPEPLKEKKMKGEGHPPLWKILEHVDKKKYLPAVATFFCFVVGFSMMMTLLALFFYHRYGVNELKVGYVYTMFGIIAIVLEGGLFGFLSQKFSSRRIATIGALLLVGASFVMPLTWSTAMAVGCCAILAIGDSLLTPVLPTVVSKSAKEQWQGAAFGFYQSAGCLARCVGPVMAGSFLAINLQGPHYALTSFWIASGFLLISFFFSLRLPK